MQDHRYPLHTFMQMHLDRFTTRERSMIFTALHMAVLYHGNKPRRTGEPGWEHCLYVAAKTAEAGHSAIAIVCALLHDIIEDRDDIAERLKRDIKREFGNEALETVLILTKVDEAVYMVQLETGCVKYFQVAPIKMYDRTHNVSTVVLLDSNREWQLSYLEESLDEVIPTLERCAALMPREHYARYILDLTLLKTQTRRALDTVSNHTSP